MLTTNAELLAPSRCALLVIDIQNENLSDRGGYAAVGTTMAATQGAIKAISWLVRAARSAGVLVVLYAEFIH